MLTTKKLGTGHFQVCWGGQETIYAIFNGYLGLSGRNTPNIYGIVNNLTHKSIMVGSLAQCKKRVKLSIERKLAAGDQVFA